MKSGPLGSNLTYEEQRTRRLEYDLGPGYPDISAPTRRLLSNLSGDIFGARVHYDGVQAGISDTVATTLEQGLKTALGVRSRQTCYAVQTGSIALHRAIASSEQFLRSRGRSATKLFTTTPCIDIIPAMARELISGGVEGLTMGLEGDFTSLDAASILAEVNDHLVVSDDCGAILVLTSPENPSGRIWPAAVLEELISSLDAERVVLILDHCFLLVGTKPGNQPSAVWELDDANRPWIGVWDTGKTFGLAGDKLGFLIVPNGVLNPHVQDAISITQYDVSNRSKLLFSSILNSEDLNRFLFSQLQICSKNLALLKEQIEPIGYRVLEPLGGTLSLLRTPPGFSAKEAVESAAVVGVGVIDASVFFAPPSEARDLVRVALARSTHDFSKAVGLLTAAWSQ